MSSAKKLEGILETGKEAGSDDSFESDKVRVAEYADDGFFANEKKRGGLTM